MQPFSRARLDPVLAFLRRQRSMFSLGSLVMYALAFVAELPVILARFLLATIAAIVVLELQGHPNGKPSWAQLALIPTAWSMLAMLTPVGSAWWWRTRAGARDPSTREQAAYDDAVELLQTYSTRPLPLPARWFVLDMPQPDAAVCGNALMLSRGVLESEDLPAVLAHELADFLEIHALIHDHPVPFIWLSEHTHPPTELRIDRLRTAAHRQLPTTAASLNGRHPGQPQITTP